MSEHAGHGAWLPPFTVRVHRAARRVRLRVTAREGLVVTLPPGVPREAAAAAVAEHRDWAARVLERTAERRALFEAGPAALLPRDVPLRMAGAVLPVEYRRTSSARCSVRDDGDVVLVSGAADVPEACLAALSRWRDRMAAELLPPVLEDVATNAGVQVPRLTLRTQRCRWGSYSSRRGEPGSVSLNRNLIFLPPDLVRHVAAHEVAHARHANHSPAFWEHLESLDPGAREKRARLRQARDSVPPWAEP